MYIIKSKEVVLEGIGKREVGKLVVVGCFVSMWYNFSLEWLIVLFFEEYYFS